MQGVVLAAGRGKRLHPISTVRSKAMAPVAGRPMVAWVMDLLIGNGVREFVMVVSPDDAKIQEYFTQQRDVEADVCFVVQEERLGMAHALRLATPHLKNGFVLTACDNLVPPAHVADLLALHRRRQANATLSLMEVDRACVSSTGVVVLEDGWVRRIVEKPKPEEAPSTTASLPLYVFSSRLLTYLPEVTRSARGEYELQDGIQLLIDREGGVTGLFTAERKQLTTPEDLLALNRHYLNAQEPLRHGAQGEIAASTRLLPPVLIDRDSYIGPECEIGPHVTIERNCRIESGAVIRDAILLAGTTVRAGERIEHQVVLPVEENQ